MRLRDLYWDDWLAARQVNDASNLEVTPKDCQRVTWTRLLSLTCLRSGAGLYWKGQKVWCTVEQQIILFFPTDAFQLMLVTVWDPNTETTAYGQTRKIHDLKFHRYGWRHHLLIQLSGTFFQQRLFSFNVLTRYILIIPETIHRSSFFLKTEGKNHEQIMIWY